MNENEKNAKALALGLISIIGAGAFAFWMESAAAGIFMWCAFVMLDQRSITNRTE